MSDNQWPRFEVFLQDRAGRPHQNAGSVHAPDAEMALQNARDVFVRRPDCLSLWVAPATAIFARTAEELAAGDAGLDAPAGPDAPAETYYIFQKKSQRRSMTYVTHVGEVEARSPAQALQRALERFENEQVYVWWVCPASALTRSEDEAAESFFGPARDKQYRQPQAYRTFSQMQEIKRG